jgi:hypothetical protein
LLETVATFSGAVPVADSQRQILLDAGDGAEVEVGWSHRNRWSDPASAGRQIDADCWAPLIMLAIVSVICAPDAVARIAR